MPLFGLIWWGILNGAHDSTTVLNCRADVHFSNGLKSSGVVLIGQLRAHAPFTEFKIIVKEVPKQDSTPSRETALWDVNIVRQRRLTQ